MKLAHHSYLYDIEYLSHYITSIHHITGEKGGQVGEGGGGSENTSAPRRGGCSKEVRAPWGS